VSEAAVMATPFLLDRRGEAPACLSFEAPHSIHGPDLADRLELSEGQAVSQSPSATPAVL
jgi:hypothetical protein